MDRDELRVQVTSVGPAAKRPTLDMQYRREAFAVRAARCVRRVDSRSFSFLLVFQKIAFEVYRVVWSTVSVCQTTTVDLPR